MNRLSGLRLKNRSSQQRNVCGFQLQFQSGGGGGGGGGGGVGFLFSQLLYENNAVHDFKYAMAKVYNVLL